MVLVVQLVHTVEVSGADDMTPCTLWTVLYATQEKEGELAPEYPTEACLFGLEVTAETWLCER